MNLRLVIGALAGLMLGGASLAQDRLADVLVFDRGGPQIWLALDGNITGLRTESQSGRLALRLDGFIPGADRTIIPALSSQISQVRLIPESDGSWLIIEGQFERAEPILAEGGVLIRLNASANTPVMNGTPSGSGTVIASGDALATSGAGEAWTIAPAPTTQHSASASTASASPPAEPAVSGAHLGTPTSAMQAHAPAPAQDRSDGFEGADPSENRVEASINAVSEGVDDERSVTSVSPPEVAAVQGESESGEPRAPAPCEDSARVLADSPWDLGAMTRHADCLVSVEDRDGAAALYERVLAFDPTHFRAAIGLARIREAQGRQGEAAQLYERAASAALTDGEALAARAAADRNADDDEREEEDG